MSTATKPRLNGSALRRAISRRHKPTPLPTVVNAFAVRHKMLSFDSPVLDCYCLTSRQATTRIATRTGEGKLAKRDNFSCETVKLRFDVKDSFTWVVFQFHLAEWIPKNYLDVPQLAQFDDCSEMTFDQGEPVTMPRREALIECVIYNRKEMEAAKDDENGPPLFHWAVPVEVGQRNEEGFICFEFAGQYGTADYNFKYPCRIIHPTPDEQRELAFAGGKGADAERQAMRAQSESEAANGK
jgi:hypothetical protein